MPPSPLRIASPVLPQAPPPAAPVRSQAPAPATVPTKSIADLAPSRPRRSHPGCPTRALEVAGPDEVAAYFRAAHNTHGAITTILLSFF